MEILYNELYKIFVQELININIGHLPDKKALFTYEDEEEDDDITF